jgi:hypothetical protein
VQIVLQISGMGSEEETTSSKGVRVPRLRRCLPGQVHTCYVFKYQHYCKLDF